MGFIVLGLALYAPWLRPGYMLAHDWRSGPHDRIPAATYGFVEGRGSVTPLVASIRALKHVTFGVDPIVLVMVLSPALLALGMSRLLGRAPISWAAGACLAAVNPFVYERLGSGAFGVILAFLLLPFIVANAQLAAGGSLMPALRLALLTAMAVAASPQSLLFGPFAAVVTILFCRRGNSRRRPFLRSCLSWSAAFGSFVCMLAYWLLPALDGGYAEYESVSRADLGLFATRGDPDLGLPINVLGLYGFWRPGPVLPKDRLSGWPFLLAALLVLVVLGGYETFRRRTTRPLATALSVTAVAGFFLAMGDQGPTGPAFTWLYDHAPGFRALREPQKALVLFLLPYAFFYGAGAARLWARAAGRGAKLLALTTAVALPLVYSFPAFWGLSGYIEPSRFPTSWGQADRVMKDPTGSVLVLPWHLFVAFPWTEGRVVDNPASVYFTRDVISGDNLELGPIRTQSSSPRSELLTFLFAHGHQTHSAGNVLAPLGIRYVLLSKTVDWERYQWIYSQTDLRLVREWDDLVLFENIRFKSIAYAPHADLELADWGEVVGSADTISLTDYAVRVQDLRGGPVRARPALSPTAASRPLTVTARSPVHVSVADPPEARMVLTEPYDRSWRLGAARPVPNLGATNLFRSNSLAAGTGFRYSRWALVRLSYALSAGVTLAVLVTLVTSRVRGRPTSPPASPRQ